MMLAKLLKQPLVHFLVLGGLIFLAYALTADPAAEAEAESGGKTIVVDRATLLDYMQYQAQAFEPEVFEARLAAMSEDEVKALVAAYVREEALYREGLGMGLDQADYVIRQRIVQKMEFLLENLVAANINPTDAELQAYYDAHLADYVADSAYTFTHIFLDGQADMDAARARADALLAQSANITFEQSSQHGDRYPFLQNYVERTRDFVSNNFSADFVAQLDMLAPGETWQGPFASRYGWHLVMLRARTEPATPALADIRSRVLEDYRYEALLQSREDAEARVIADYPVELRLE
jgi:parvulin-like peptidyl-prolyl isomerase